MDVRNCKQCGRLYNYIGGSYRNLCPACVRKIEDKFSDVKEFINKNEMATMSEISQECGVSIKQIEQWVREERLFFSDDSPIGISCENCGKMIKSGRYCDSCKETIANKLGSAYSQDPTVQALNERRKQKDRSKFLDMKTTEQLASIRENKKK